MKSGYLALLLISLFIQANAQGDIWTVGHTSGFDFQSLTAAMAAASAGDEIRVAEGTYSANDPQYPETFPIYLKTGVKLIRLTPDIMPVIDGVQTGQVFICANIPSGSNTWIEGLKITGGDTYESPTAGSGLSLDNATLTIHSCEISGNSAEGGDEGGGGGIGLDDSNLELINCLIQENRAKTSAYNDGKGAGMAARNSSITLINCIVKANQATLAGGGIYSTGSALKFTQCTLTENSAYYPGGGIYSEDSSLEFTQCTFSSNSANEGGGIYFGPASTGDVTTFDRCTFTGNSSTYHDGGGVYFSTMMDPAPIFSYCTFNDNASMRYGGGISVYNTELLLLFTRFFNNSASPAGGGIYCNAADLKAIGCEFNSNNGSSNGGGIYGIASDLQVFSCQFTANSVHEFGGGLSAVQSSSEFTNCTFDSNHAGDGGGAIALDSTNLTLLNSILWNNNTDELFSFNTAPNVQYCDIQGGFTGAGNIDADPLFTEGYKKFHYLAQAAAGQSADSPCLNAGSDVSANISISLSGKVFSLSDASTRTDRIHDVDRADMGVHYFQDPTECDVTGCEILMPSTDFGPGDLCYCKLLVSSTSLDTIPNIPVLVVLEVAGIFLFAPEFDDFSYYSIDLLPGVQFIQVIPSFFWPSGAGSASDVHWYAAMTNPEMSELLGEFDMFTFGWHS